MFCRLVNMTMKLTEKLTYYSYSPHGSTPIEIKKNLVRDRKLCWQSQYTSEQWLTLPLKDCLGEGRRGGRFDTCISRERVKPWIFLTFDIITFLTLVISFLKTSLKFFKSFRRHKDFLRQY